MNICIFSIGTQGDVRPFVALGVGLQAKGHRVCIATGKSCEALVRDSGLDYAPLTADFLEVMARDPEVLQRGLNPLALLKTARRELKAMSADWPEQAMSAARGASLLMGNGMVAALASALAERFDIPMVETHLQPVSPCPDIPPMMLPPPQRPRPGVINQGLYHACRVLTWQMMAPAYAAVREQLKLPPLPWYGPFYRRKLPHRVLYGFSPSLIPPSPHWPENVKVAGNWFLDEGERWQPPLALSEFLAAGPKPVYVGFGSMLGGDAQRLSDIWRQALRNTGQRGIFATGWGGLTAVDDAQIFCLSAAPHDWLFPRVAAAVHHGGAGTTAAAAKAGVPSVVMPFFGDQPFWAWRLASLGAAPAAVTRKTLSVDSATEALRYALTAPCQDKAAELGQRIRAEDGVDEAIAQLQRWQLLPGMPDFQLAGSAA
ncbi:glycosyltransferase [Spongiibacter tropicus]|uniref:glycosyltransferase n=1 Tax=Spongiibacter tropicus TaxID=454602 RepID=UPI0003B38353|nr:glycosyltransferase [Spongiibacter tropicus]